MHTATLNLQKHTSYKHSDEGADLLNIEVSLPSGLKLTHRILNSELQSVNTASSAQWSIGLGNYCSMVLSVKIREIQLNP